jgi:hypothetical protein
MRYQLEQGESPTLGAMAKFALVTITERTPVPAMTMLRDIVATQSQVSAARGTCLQKLR